MLFRRKSRTKQLGSTEVQAGISTASEPTTIYNPKKFTISKKLIFQVSLLVIILVGLGFLFNFSKGRVIGRDQCRYAPSQVNKQAAEDLTNYKYADLKIITEKMQKQKGYDMQVSCLYPVAMYSINSGNVTKAQSLVAKLQTVSNNGKIALPKPYSSLTINSVAKVQTQLNNLVISSETLHANTLLFN